MSPRQKLVFTLRLPLRQKVWLLACLCGAVISPLLLRWRSGVQLMPRNTVHIGNRQLCTLVSARQSLQARQVGMLMSNVANNIPWDCKCLAQALCVQRLLNWLNIPSVFYLGARFDQQQPESLKAHAWISVGPYVVVGRGGHRDYQVTASFINCTPNKPCLQSQKID